MKRTKVEKGGSMGRAPKSVKSQKIVTKDQNISFTKP